MVGAVRTKKRDGVNRIAGGFAPLVARAVAQTVNPRDIHDALFEDKVAWPATGVVAATLVTKNGDRVVCVHQQLGPEDVQPIGGTRVVGPDRTIIAEVKNHKTLAGTYTFGSTSNPRTVAAFEYEGTKTFGIIQKQDHYGVSFGNAQVQGEDISRLKEGGCIALDITNPNMQAPSGNLIAAELPNTKPFGFVVNDTHNNATAVVVGEGRAYHRSNVIGDERGPFNVDVQVRP